MGAFFSSIRRIVYLVFAIIFSKRRVDRHSLEGPPVSTIKEGKETFHSHSCAKLQLASRLSSPLEEKFDVDILAELETLPVNVLFDVLLTVPGNTIKILAKHSKWINFLTVSDNFRIQWTTVHGLRWSNLTAATTNYEQYYMMMRLAAELSDVWAIDLYDRLSHDQRRYILNRFLQAGNKSAATLLGQHEYLEEAKHNITVSKAIASRKTKGMLQLNFQQASLMVHGSRQNRAKSPISAVAPTFAANFLPILERYGCTIRC